MTTTTIRVEDDLKARVAAAADRAGKTAHAFVVDAIAQTVAQAELEEELHRVADRRRAKVLATGRTVNRTDARSHVDARMRGGRPARAGGPHAPARVRPVSRIELAPEVLDDFDRFIDHLRSFEVEESPARVAEIMQAIDILPHNRPIGRPARRGHRELIIGRGSHGYIALCRYTTDPDTVFALALRSRREVAHRQDG